MKEEVKEILEQQLEFLKARSGEGLLTKDQTNLLKVLTDLLANPELKSQPEAVESSLDTATLLKMVSSGSTNDKT